MKGNIGPDEDPWDSPGISCSSSSSAGGVILALRLVLGLLRGEDSRLSKSLSLRPSGRSSGALLALLGVEKPSRLPFSLLPSSWSSLSPRLRLFSPLGGGFLAFFLSTLVGRRGRLEETLSVVELLRGAGDCSLGFRRSCGRDSVGLVEVYAPRRDWSARHVWSMFEGGVDGGVESGFCEIEVVEVDAGAHGRAEGSSMIVDEMRCDVMRRVG